MWLTLIKQYWQISLFKQTPADTPYSPLLLSAIMVFFFFLIVVQWMISDVQQQLTVSSAMLIAGLLVLSYAVYTCVLLLMNRQSLRIVQTLSCLLASHSIVHLFAFPLLLILTPLLIETNTTHILGPFVGIMYLVLTLILTVWQFAVTTYIYKHALTIDYLPALLASLGLLACNILTVSFWR